MRVAWAIAALLMGSFTVSGADAAVRNCTTLVTSGPQAAVMLATGQQLAISAWAKAAGISGGERRMSWRLAANRSLNCAPAPDKGFICEAKGVPCMIEQAPSKDLVPVRPSPKIEPKVIPVPPAKVIKI
jgi:hypothetical protein